MARLPIPTSTGIRNKEKRYSFIDEVVKSKKIVPSPQKYLNQDVWCSPRGTGRQSGSFLKDERITTTQGIFKREKQFPIPAANAYNTTQAWKYTQGKVPGTYSPRDIQVCFIDESIAISKDSPPTGRYKVVNLEKYKKRTEKWQIYKDKKMGERL